MKIIYTVGITVVCLLAVILSGAAPVFADMEETPGGADLSLLLTECRDNPADPRPIICLYKFVADAETDVLTPRIREQLTQVARLNQDHPFFLSRAAAYLLQLRYGLDDAEMFIRLLNDSSPYVITSVVNDAEYPKVCVQAFTNADAKIKKEIGRIAIRSIDNLNLDLMTKFTLLRMANGITPLHHQSRPLPFSERDRGRTRRRYVYDEDKEYYVLVLETNREPMPDAVTMAAPSMIEDMAQELGMSVEELTKKIEELLERHPVSRHHINALPSEPFLRLYRLLTDCQLKVFGIGHYRNAARRMMNQIYHDRYGVDTYQITDSLEEYLRFRHEYPTLAVASDDDLTVLLWRPEPFALISRAGQYRHQNQFQRRENFTDEGYIASNISLWLSEAYGGENLFAGIKARAIAGNEPSYRLREALQQFAELATAAYQAEEPGFGQQVLQIGQDARGFWRSYLAYIAALAGVRLDESFLNTELLENSLTDEQLEYGLLAFQNGERLQETFTVEELSAIMLWQYPDFEFWMKLRKPPIGWLFGLREALLYLHRFELKSSEQLERCEGQYLNELAAHFEPKPAQQQFDAWLKDNTPLPGRWKNAMELSPQTAVALAEKYGFNEIARRYIRIFDTEYWDGTAFTDAAAAALYYRERDERGYTPPQEIERLRQTFTAFLDDPEPYLACLDDEARLVDQLVLTRPIFNIPYHEASKLIDVGDAALRLRNFGRGDTITISNPTDIYLWYNKEGIYSSCEYLNPGTMSSSERYTIKVLFDPDRSYRNSILFSLAPYPCGDTMTENDDEASVNLIPWEYFNLTAPPVDGSIWGINFSAPPYGDLRAFRDIKFDLKRIHLENFAFLSFGTSYQSREILPLVIESGFAKTEKLLLGLMGISAALVMMLIWQRRHRQIRNRRKQVSLPSIPPPTTRMDSPEREKKDNA